MQEIIEIERACASDNHETVVSMLDSINSFDLKKEAFLKIIGYYEEKSLSPVGYLLLFIRSLIQNNDYKTAMEYIKKCRVMGVAEERLSKLIFENLIKPKEAFYRENFHENIQLLQKHNILFSKQEFDFDKIKNQILVIENMHPEISDDLLKKFDKDKRLLLIDIMNIEFINSLLNSIDIYLVYDDVQLFYHMLLFEDLSGMDKYIKQKRLIFFVGKGKELLEDFFLNLSTIPPGFCFGLSLNKQYTEIIKEIVVIRSKKHESNLKALNDIYKDYDFRYYRDLFEKGPSDIKIMLITSESTEINKFIVKNWYEAFLEMGYQAKLLIEDENYELISNYVVYNSMKEFRPDIVFHINYTVNDIFNDEGETRKNILWITRFRDRGSTELYNPSCDFKYHNMFILPIFLGWGEQLKVIGVPGNRILHTSDGININTFRYREKTSSQYACDIVCVNSAVGSVDSRLNYYLRETTIKGYKKAVFEVVEVLKESVNDEKTIFQLPNCDDIKNMMEEKLSAYGMCFRDDPAQININKTIVYMFEHIVDSLCRGRIMEWIIDSGITTNIKLWGKGWSNIEKFKKFHMGMAKHGDELSNIYRSSKISISDSPWSLHERNFEILASGGFPLIRYAKLDEGDVEKMNEITCHFKENEEVVLFYARDDLLNKIQHYLDNPEERERIAENGRQLVINSFSHIAIAEKTIGIIKKFYFNRNNN